MRTRLGWSQERLARELGVSFSTVSRWERGDGEPSPMAVRLLQELSRQAASEAWLSADQIDASTVTGLFEGPTDLSTRHDAYLDEADAR